MTLRLLGWVLTIAVLEAQPTGVPDRSSLKASYRADFAYTGRGDLADEAGGGGIDARLATASYTRSIPLHPRFSLAAGALWQGLWFDVPANAPVPSSAHAVAARVSGQWRPADRWTIRADLRPGVYSDWQDLSGQDFNMPALAAVSYTISTNLVVLVGMNINLWSELATIGGPGVIWRFADQWRLNLVLPKPTLEFSPTKSWGVFVGGELRGGSFRVAETFGDDQGRPDLNGDKFAYREIRAGAGVRYALGPVLRATLEGGYAFDREFEFRDADWEFRAQGAPFVQVGISGAY